MCAAAKKGGKKAPAKGKKRPAGKGSGRKPAWPVVVAVAMPLLAVGGFVAYHNSAGLSASVDRTTDKVVRFVSNLFDSNRSGDPDLTVPEDRRTVPQRPRREPRREAPAPEAAPEIPRQQTRTAQAAAAPLTVKEAQHLARALFGGRVTASRSEAGAFWYEFEMAGGKKTWPFDVAPARVSVATVALRGPFVKGVSGTLVFVKAEDPRGPQWMSTYVGATLFAGPPDKPGKVLGSTAMQAPGGVVTRHEALDVTGNGILELVLEVESQAPGGYVVRDLALHAFTTGGTRVKWHTRTLDDGPGVPLDKATFKHVAFVDTDGDGTLEIEVKKGVRTFKINKDMSRSLETEKLGDVQVLRLTRGRFRVAKN